MQTMQRVARRAWSTFAVLCLAATSCRDATGPSDVTRVSGGSAAAHGGTNSSKVMAIHVTITSSVGGATLLDRYTFHVMRHGDEIQGRFQVRQSRMIEGAERAIVEVSGDMVCMTITGNRARVGGRVDETSFPEGIPVGSELTWSVTDNGTSANVWDFASQPLGNNAHAYCLAGLPYPEHLVDAGKVTVRN